MRHAWVQQALIATVKDALPIGRVHVGAGDAGTWPSTRAACAGALVVTGLALARGSKVLALSTCRRRACSTRTVEDDAPGAKRGSTAGRGSVAHVQLPRPNRHLVPVAHCHKRPVNRGTVVARATREEDRACAAGRFKLNDNITPVLRVEVERDLHML